MKNRNTSCGFKMEFSRLDRVALHLRCLIRDHKYRWHLAGILREVTLH